MTRPEKIGVALVLVAVLAACAGPGTGEAVTATDDSQVWQQQLAEARRLAADGKNYLLVVRPQEAGAAASGGVHVFHNSADPVCYTYTVPGEWLAGGGDNTYRSTNGKAVVGIRFLRTKDLEKVEGVTLLERARKFVTAEYEKGLGRTLASAGLVPFESKHPDTWKWMVTGKTKDERQVLGVTNLLVDLKPDAVVQVAVSGTKDDDALARGIVESFQTTADSECYWPLLEQTLKDASAKK